MNNQNFRSIFIMKQGIEEELHDLKSSSLYQKRSIIIPSITNNDDDDDYNQHDLKNSHWDDLMNHPIEDIIKTIPDYYPLERTHTIVSSKNIRTVVIPNLRNCFRTLGIQVITTDGFGASLITKEYIDIHLYFWKMKNNDFETDSRVYIELQRRQGDSIMYHYYVKQILKAATAVATNVIQDKGINKNPKYDSDAKERRYSPFSTTTTTIFPPPLIPGMNNSKNESILSNHDETRGSYNPSLESSYNQQQQHSCCYPCPMAIGLLKSKQLDSQMLGMESLCMLTDPSKTDRSVAFQVSRDIIFGNDNNDFLHTFVFKMVLLLQQPKEGQSREDDEYDSDFYDDDDDDDFLFQQQNNNEDYDIWKLLPNIIGCSRKNYSRAIVILRNYALTILSNAWEVLYYHRQNLIQEEERNDEAGEDLGATLFSFSSAVTTTATKIIEHSNSKVKLPKQQYNKNYHHNNDDNSIMNLIIQVLWKDIACAHYKPHNACLAIKCLSFLFRFWQKYILSEEEQCILQRAKMVGKATNIRLETLSRELLHQIVI